MIEDSDMVPIKLWSLEKMEFPKSEVPKHFRLSEPQVTEKYKIYEFKQLKSVLTKLALKNNFKVQFSLFR